MHGPWAILPAEGQITKRRKGGDPGRSGNLAKKKEGGTQASVAPASSHKPFES